MGRVAEGNRAGCGGAVVGREEGGEGVNPNGKGRREETWSPVDERWKSWAAVGWLPSAGAESLRRFLLSLETRGVGD